MTRPLIHKTLTVAVLGAFSALAASCSSIDFGDTLYTGFCVASEANCLKDCREDYRSTAGVVSYDYCAMQCQPGGRSGCD